MVSSVQNVSQRPSYKSTAIGSASGAAIGAAGCAAVTGLYTQGVKSLNFSDKRKVISQAQTLKSVSSVSPRTTVSKMVKKNAKKLILAAIGISALVGAAAGLAIDTHNNRKVQKSTDVDLNA